ncbi:MAG: hypothetical protein ABR499_05560 [Gemmatimonadaceae bacterium]
MRRLDVAPARFRPGGWSDEHILWGLVRGRVTRLDTRNGETRTLAATGWWVQAAPNVAAWQNETGTWLLRDGGAPERLAGPAGDPERSGDGPTVLLSRDGTRALLGWQQEWDGLYDLLERDGSRHRLETRIPGYFLTGAALWLDSARGLFQTVATAPIGGEPTYRERGWRGALAVFDLRTNAYTLVANVPDFTYLRVVGPYLDDVLVTEWDASGSVRAHWLYDPRTWRRRPTSLPKGRAFASPAGAVVVLLDPQADSTDAVLIADGETRSIGRVARDGEPAFSPSGRRGALRTANGVMVFEPTP